MLSFFIEPSDLSCSSNFKNHKIHRQNPIELLKTPTAYFLTLTLNTAHPTFGSKLVFFVWKLSVVSEILEKSRDMKSEVKTVSRNEGKISKQLKNFVTLDYLGWRTQIYESSWKLQNYIVEFYWLIYFNVQTALNFAFFKHGTLKSGRKNHQLRSCLIDSKSNKNILKKKKILGGLYKIWTKYV